jgi:GNAT superfamily N-acetyltransferase
MHRTGTPAPIVVVRAHSDDDLKAMIQVRAAADPHSSRPRLDNLRHNLASNPDLAYLVARAQDAPVGCGFVDVSHENAARAHVLVAPLARRQGVGTALLAGASERAHAVGLVELEGPVRADDESSLAFFERRGFRKAGGEEAVVLDLAEVGIVTAEPPAGVRVVTRAEAPETVEGMYEVACEAEPDIPGGTPVRPFEVWRANEIDRPSLEPELTFIALAGDEVVGYAILDSLRGEPWHRLTAVKRAWRGRGIATALKRAQIQAAQKKGFARLVTTNEERNRPMRSINRALGYRPEPGLSTIVMRGPLLMSETHG